MRIPACLGVRSYARRHRHTTQVHTQAGSTATHDPQPIRSFMSLHRMVRPHTTSHAASRMCVPAATVRISSRGLCNTRVETRAEFARVKRAKRDPLDVPFVADRGCYAMRWRNTLPHVLALPRRNGFRTVHTALSAVCLRYRRYLVLRNLRGRSVGKATVASQSRRNC